MAMKLLEPAEERVDRIITNVQNEKKWMTRNV